MPERGDETAAWVLVIVVTDLCSAAAASLPRGTLSASSSESESAAPVPSSFRKNRMAVTAIFVVWHKGRQGPPRRTQPALSTVRTRRRRRPERRLRSAATHGRATTPPLSYL